MSKLAKQIRPLYHGTLAWFGHWWYGRPSSDMWVIGITGTKGKSTITYLTYQMFHRLGIRTGMSSSVYMSAGKTPYANPFGNSMPGRTRLHRLIKEAKTTGCTTFVMEVTSEGLAQNRHLGIAFDGAICSNLHPEHLEAHGGFENYKKAKGELFEALDQSLPKTIYGKTLPNREILNQDDEHWEYFARIGSQETATIGLSDTSDIYATDIRTTASHTQFQVHFSDDDSIYAVTTPLLGTFNVYNALFVIALCDWFGCDREQVAHSLAYVENIPGRMQVIHQHPTIIVDYAHTAEALEQVYTTLRQVMPQDGQLIGVLGSAGGGRDTWKRKPMGEMAGKYLDYAIVTDEDPYDEDPQKIIDEVFQGVITSQKEEDTNAFRILSRRQAFEKALSLATDNDVIIITGKGSEHEIHRAGGTVEPWNDREEMLSLVK